MSEPNYKEYDEKFDRWMTDVNKLLGRELVISSSTGTPVVEDNPSADLYGSFDEGMTPREFVDSL